MGSDQNNNSGCLFPYGDDFLPILIFLFHLNQLKRDASNFDVENETNESVDNPCN